MPRRIESHTLTGPVGELEALLEEPEDRDTLQQAIKLLRDSDFGIEMQFINFRTN